MKPRQLPGIKPGRSILLVPTSENCMDSELLSGSEGLQR